jgi:hypothetical protein
MLRVAASAALSPSVPLPATMTGIITFIMRE